MVQSSLLPLLLLLAAAQLVVAIRLPLSDSSPPSQATAQQGPPPATLFEQLQQQIAQQQRPQQQQAPSSSSGAATSTAPFYGQGLPPVQPWQPWQQLQQQLAAQTPPQNSSSSSSDHDGLKPGSQFVTISQQQRGPGFKQSSQQQQQQQQEQSAPPGAPAPDQPFACGKPFQPCGSAIPQGKSCPNGPGWCEAGFFCGFEATNTEPSRCLPLPKDCGKAGRPCCPSNTDSPHTSLQDKLTRKPFCKDGSVCFFYAPEPGLNNGDSFAANKGAYACTAVAADCGSGPGKPCCPWADKIATNPRLNNTGCSGGLFCNYDVTPVAAPLAAITSAAAAAAAASVSSELLQASVSGTCEANTADCGQFGRRCCIFTSPWATSVGCGARWNETGQRGYCADPFDGNNSYKARAASGRSLLNSGGGGSGGGSSGGGGGSGGAGGGGSSNGSSGSNGSGTNSTSSSGSPGNRSSNTGSTTSGSGTGTGGSSSSFSGSGRIASFKELVCTPCPPRSENVADNPNKYWPC